MKKAFILLFSLALFSFQSVSDKSGKVVGVSDGDTIKVLLDGVETKIRFANIDAPEKSQAFGQAAKKFTSDACFGKVVTIRITDIDRYGRSIALVILPNGEILNRNLVASGYAWHYKRYSNDASLDDLQTNAREKKLGLWAEANPVAPWEFRKTKGI